VSEKKKRSTVSNQEAHQKMVQVLQDENLKLKNEINTLRADRGSTELINSYKQQIQDLNERIHNLEQEKSNLHSTNINMKNDYEVRLSSLNVRSQTDIKKSTVTNDYNDIRNSEMSRDSRMTSPVQ
jgi:TolA-binding protein